LPVDWWGDARISYRGYTTCRSIHVLRSPVTIGALSKTRENPIAPPKSGSDNPRYSEPVYVLDIHNQQRYQDDKYICQTNNEWSVKKSRLLFFPSKEPRQRKLLEINSQE